MVLHLECSLPLYLPPVSLQLRVFLPDECSSYSQLELLVVLALVIVDEYAIEEAEHIVDGSLKELLKENAYVVELR
jgi:hypothetical protein